MLTMLQKFLSCWCHKCGQIMADDFVPAHSQQMSAHVSKCQQMSANVTRRLRRKWFLMRCVDAGMLTMLQKIMSCCCHKCGQIMADDSDAKFRAAKRIKHPQVSLSEWS